MKKRIITNEQINDFKLYLYEEERSENTIAKYIRDILSFSQRIGSKRLEKTDMLEYKKELCEKYAPRSVNSILSAINMFFAFLGWHELKVRTLKIQRQIFAEKSKELTKAEYVRLLIAAKRNNNSRLYYLLQTMAGTGIRVSEIKYITCEAVKNGQTVINCKNKIRKIFLPKQLCKMLKAYIREQNIKNGSVFVSKQGRPLDRSNIWKMLKDLCESANVSKEKVFPHNFRHLFARTYYSLQKDIVRLADLLGHSCIETTRIYTVETCDVCCRQIQQLGLLHC